jgi:hypothetical protein
MTKMNVTFNSNTIAFLIQELDDILGNADITMGMSDDMSTFLNALMNIEEMGAIVIVQNDDNLGDDWDDSPDPVSPLLTA